MSAKLIFIILAFSFLNSAVARPKVGILKSIYGNDDRYNVSDYDDTQFRLLSKSTVAQVSRRDLNLNFNFDFYEFSKTTLEDRYSLCEEEQFRKEHHIARCSGFLVAPDIIVTAGHCVASAEDCRNNKWVFDYTDGIDHIKRSQVYGCKKILDQEIKNNFFVKKDYAIIQLDRAVHDRSPLKIRTEGKLKKGQDVVVIGHPLGLPTKITDGGQSSKWNIIEKILFPSSAFRRSFYFTANLDAFAGNSGSPVINKKTKLVEGILVSGANDYIEDKKRGCFKSKRYSNNHNFVYEKVFKITKIPFLQKREKKSQEKK